MISVTRAAFAQFFVVSHHISYITTQSNTIQLNTSTAAVDSLVVRPRAILRRLSPHDSLVVRPRAILRRQAAPAINVPNLPRHATANARCLLRRIDLLIG